MKKNVTGLLLLIALIIMNPIFAQIRTALPEFPKPTVKTSHGDISIPPSKPNQNNRPTSIAKPNIYFPPPIQNNPYPNRNTNNRSYDNIDQHHTLMLSASKKIGYSVNTTSINYRSWINSSGVLDTLKALQVAVQYFHIAQSENTFMFTSQNGITFEFPAKAFVDALGNPVSGPVDLSLQEFNKYCDFAAAGLTSSSTDGQMLESGGMIDLKAKSGDINLQMAENKTYQINGNSTFKEGYQTFYGVNAEQSTWTNNSADATESNRNNNGSNNNGLNNNSLPPQETGPFTITILPVLQLHNGISNILMVDDGDAGKPLHSWLYNQVKISKKLQNKIKKSGIHFPATIEISASGQIVNVFLNNADQAQNSLMTEILPQISILKNAPPLFYLVKDSITTQYRRVDVTAGQIPIQFITASKKGLENKILPLPLLPNSLALMAKNVGGNWMLQSNSLQLVNCDRFSSAPKSKDTAFFIIPRGDALVYYAFFDYNALLKPNVVKMTNTGYQYGLSSFAAGAKMRIVSIVYEDNGKVHLEVVDTQKGKYEPSELKILPFNQITFKAAFELRSIEDLLLLAGKKIINSSIPEVIGSPKK